MKHWKRVAAIASVTAVGILVPLGLTTLAQVGDADAELEEVRHKGPPDLQDGSYEVIEYPRGLTANGPVTLEIGHGSIVIPKGEGIFWGYGDVPCGQGLEVTLTKGTVVCFDDDHGEVEVRGKHPDDRRLVKLLLASAKEYRVRPSIVTGELP